MSANMNKRQPLYVLLIALFTLALLAWVSFAMRDILHNLPAWFSAYGWLQIIAFMGAVMLPAAFILGKIKFIKRNTFLYVMLVLSCAYIVLVGGDFVFNMVRDLNGAYCSGLFGVRSDCVSGSWWRFMLLYLPIGIPIAWMTFVSLGYVSLTSPKSQSKTPSKKKSQK